MAGNGSLNETIELRGGAGRALGICVAIGVYGEFQHVLRAGARRRDYWQIKSQSFYDSTLVMMIRTYSRHCAKIIIDLMLCVEQSI